VLSSLSAIPLSTTAAVIQEWTFKSFCNSMTSSLLLCIKDFSKQHDKAHVQQLIIREREYLNFAKCKNLQATLIQIQTNENKEIINFLKNYLMTTSYF
jgi:hypothetical protein